jgi:hypothetical protein
MGIDGPANLASAQGERAARHGLVPHGWLEVGCQWRHRQYNGVRALCEWASQAATGHSC